MTTLRLRALLPLIALGGCAAMDAQFKAELPPDFPPPHATLAIFGVFAEGQLDPAYWARIAPQVSAAFAVPSCEALYAPRLHDEDAGLFEALDARARNEGVSNELLQAIEARTQAPLIGFFYVEPPAKVARTQRADSRLPVPSPSGRRGRRGMIAQSSARPVDDTALALTFFVYSRARRDIVAQLAMRYTGQHADDAPRMFIDRLGATFGDLECVGWR